MCIINFGSTKLKVVGELSEVQNLFIYFLKVFITRDNFLFGDLFSFFLFLLPGPLYQPKHNHRLLPRPAALFLLPFSSCCCCLFLLLFLSWSCFLFLLLLSSC